jgi:hypothetical protein
MDASRRVHYGRGWISVPAERLVLNCQRCRRVFVSDHSHMAASGFCMMCRPFIVVSCRFCGDRCPGRYDGDACCQVHREMHAEELQRLFPTAPPALVTP